MKNTQKVIKEKTSIIEQHLEPQAKFILALLEDINKTVVRFNYGITDTKTNKVYLLELTAIKFSDKHTK